MKSKIVELDVDFIGGQEGLTAEEENALSAYFAKKKRAALKQAKTKTRASKHTKVIV